MCSISDMPHCIVTLCSLAAVPSPSALTNLATELSRISSQHVTQGFSRTSSMSRGGLTLTQASWYPASPESLRSHKQAPVRLLGRGSSSSSRLLKACGRGFWTAWTAASTDLSRSLQPRQRPWRRRWNSSRRVENISSDVADGIAGAVRQPAQPNCRMQQHLVGGRSELRHELDGRNIIWAGG